MELRTHKNIDPTLSGRVIELRPDYAKVALQTSQIMAADERGLVHGGFTFSAADFAAMAAVNEPYVVLSSAEVRFTAPVQVGDNVVFEAQVVQKEGKKAFIDVVGRVEDQKVFAGSFVTFIPQTHILDR
ncbi:MULTISPECIES: hotdog domain-containing protein [unclassified Nitratiruptor]|uniref:hotdog domain-containing protein n=1 Tax=unclassified Nitratiruptor TaxID=2624044 RepID=UPI0019162749|nr:MULTISPECIES: hotdog domain-containing protein [unclassified Nitratiruptor]BCD60237.1 methylthioribose-1-phosphate isomerase [Nitratiruptor sp. YY08-10]BCD64274.1 methylthioribose-1-phosphate isomerase [Nitratiruptor sp. YY08-14]